MVSMAMAWPRAASRAQGWSHAQRRRRGAMGTAARGGRGRGVRQGRGAPRRGSSRVWRGPVTPLVLLLLKLEHNIKSIGIAYV
jgi:hypothetical protein